MPQEHSIPKDPMSSMNTQDIVLIHLNQPEYKKLLSVGFCKFTAILFYKRYIFDQIQLFIFFKVARPSLDEQCTVVP